MIKLYGLPASNYYAMVKLFLLEKGFEFEEVLIKPTYGDPFLELSPMGKIPFIELDEGYISETTAILGFLESCIPDVPMTVKDPFSRAKMAQLIKIHELYIENQVRRLFGHAFFGSELNQAIADEVKPVLEKGLAAVGRLAGFSPWIMGEEMTMADFFAYYTFAVARPVAQHVWQWDVVSEIEGLPQWLEMMSNRPFVKQVNAERNAAFAKLVG